MSSDKAPAIVLVDPMSTGANLGDILIRAGKPVIAFWSASVSASLRALSQPGLREDYTATLYEVDDVVPSPVVAEAAEVKSDPSSPTAAAAEAAEAAEAAAIASKLRLPSSDGVDGSRVRSQEELAAAAAKIRAVGHPISCVVAVSELGVEYADQLAAHMGLRGNGTELTDARRDKYLMGERVRAAGVRAVGQRLCSTWEEAHAFLIESGVPEDGSEGDAAIIAAAAAEANSTEAAREYPKMVIKPARSGGSDDVFLCARMCEFKTRFNSIIGKKNKLNVPNTAVLIQEYLQGTEFVVDTVSVDGHHKLAGCWTYLKGAANGADFVYFGMRLVDSTSPVAQEVFAYTKTVLDALQVRNWCGHAEVMYHPTKGPCLVEIGSRPHGGEGIFINCARAVCGYSQVDLLASAMEGPEAFAAYPDLWTIKKGAGAVIDLVCFQRGTVKEINEVALAKMRSLKSFKGTHCLPTPGSKVTETIDCFTTIGSVELIADSEAELNADIEGVREAERDLIILEEASA